MAYHDHKFNEKDYNVSMEGGKGYADDVISSHFINIKISVLNIVNEYKRVNNIPLKENLTDADKKKILNMVNKYLTN